MRVGQELQAGDLIGEIGASGRATGPHLDWRMNWRNRRIDPQLLAPVDAAGTCALIGRWGGRRRGWRLAGRNPGQPRDRGRVPMRRDICSDPGLDSPKARQKSV